MISRYPLIRNAVFAHCAVIPVGWATPAHARDDDEEAQEDEDEGDEGDASSAEDDQEEGKHRFAEGFYVGKFRRSGMYSNLLLGFSTCMNGRGGGRCGSYTDKGQRIQTAPSFAVLKELGYRIPWAFFGVSYSLNFLRSSWTKADRAVPPFNVGYQHSVLGVIRPTLPLWRMDLGVTVAPGWSRQVYRTTFGYDRDYSQGFALGLGAVLTLHLTKTWAVGARFDMIRNYHTKHCERIASIKECMVLDPESQAGVNAALSGVYFSHRW